MLGQVWTIFYPLVIFKIYNKSFVIANIMRRNGIEVLLMPMLLLQSFNIQSMICCVFAMFGDIA